MGTRNLRTGQPILAYEVTPSLHVVDFDRNQPPHVYVQDADNRWRRSDLYSRQDTAAMLRFYRVSRKIRRYAAYGV
jgi:hypothetical protein